LFEKRTEKSVVEEKFVPWTIQQTFVGVLLTLIPWLLLALGLSSLNTKTPGATTLSPTADLINAIFTFILASLVEGAFLIAPLYFAAHPFRSMAARWRRAFDALGFRRFHVSRALRWVIVLFLGILVLNFLYSMALGYLNTRFHLQIHTNDQVILQQSRAAPRTTYATLLASVFVAPFCEEIFFRSFVFAGFLRAMSVGWAIFLSSLIFAVAHADAGSFAVLFFIGLALAFLRWRTNSIWPGMLLHALNNGLGALLIVAAMQHPVS
jgi:membrane protease YdiL (CAAX protease family)